MSQFKTMSLEDIKKNAIESKCEVVVAADNELQFDLDDLHAVAKFHDFYQSRICTRFKTGRLTVTEWSSKSGGQNKHVTVQLPINLSVPERIALQLAGGSDPGREFAALCCHWDGSENPVLLFKPLQDKEETD